MSLIKQSDVKNHLSPRFRTKIHLSPPASEPNATGFSEVEAKQPEIVSPTAGVSVPGDAGQGAVSASEQR